MWREIPQGSKSLLHQKGRSSRGSRRDQSGRLRNIPEVIDLVRSPYRPWPALVWPHTRRSPPTARARLTSGAICVVLPCAYRQESPHKGRRPINERVLSALVPQAVGHALQAARRCDRPGGRAHGSPNAMHGASADAKLFGGCENTFAGPQLALDSFFDVGSDLPRVEPLSTAR